jgi:hypothetical protein
MSPRTFGQLETGDTIVWSDSVDLGFVVVRKLWDVNGDPCLTFLRLNDGKVLTQTLPRDAYLQGYEVYPCLG